MGHNVDDVPYEVEFLAVDFSNVRHDELGKEMQNEGETLSLVDVDGSEEF